jgi:hypothetical protein
VTETTRTTKRGLFSGWDIGDTIRVVMVAGMVWLTIVAPETKSFAEPYATLSLAACYAALATALFTPQFSSRFGKPRALGTNRIALPGDRLFQIVTCLALIAATPQTILWAVETPVSEPWSLGFYWFCVALFVLAALLCLRNLLRLNDLIHLDAQGIAAPRLWQSTIPWTAIAAARPIGSRSDNALLVQFDAPREVVLLKRPFLDWAVRLGTEKRSVTIPGIMLGMPAEKIAALLQDRIREQARQA